jgi:Right handed beta helix region
VPTTTNTATPPPTTTTAPTKTAKAPPTTTTTSTPPPTTTPTRTPPPPTTTTSAPPPTTTTTTTPTPPPPPPTTTIATPSPPPPTTPPPATISGTTYYVSPTGSDSGPGTTPAQPWRTVARVNSAQLRPGDGVLFQGGATFTDSTLMPASSGAAGAPIVYGSYGSGQATITEGAWFVSINYLTFDNLALGPQAGLQGGNSSGHLANDIVVQRSTIDLAPGNSSLGINANGNGWTIADNTVQNTGDSGMLLIGDSYTVSGNTITNTGLDSSIGYGKHGIYLKASNATVTRNTITHFSADGISARYRNSTISANNISRGPIGIGFFQYDASSGTSHWTDNAITDTTAAGIFVCGTAESCAQPIESFVITGNTLGPAPGASNWSVMNLQPTSGTYAVTGNVTQ